MKKTRLFLTAGALAAGSALAQTPPSGGILYQQAGAFGVASSTAASPTIFELPAGTGPGFAYPGGMTGSPLSATRESHSLQVLGDGTRIDHSESSRFYRDSQGRTRTENGAPGAGTVLIQDPVGGFTLILNAATKTAQKMPALRVPEPKSLGPAGSEMGVAARTGARVEVRSGNMGSMATTTVTAPGGMLTAGVPVSVAGAILLPTASPTAAFVSASAPPQSVDLGSQNVNGVLAEGRKTTLSIPIGQIGNDREINVVSESWYSNDLQMIVKSSNSDPRFGETTFELTNISRAEPDPALFQAPADYTVSDPKNVQFRVPGRE